MANFVKRAVDYVFHHGLKSLNHFRVNIAATMA